MKFTYTQRPSLLQRILRHPAEILFSSPLFLLILLVLVRVV